MISTLESFLIAKTRNFCIFFSFLSEISGEYIDLSLLSKISLVFSEFRCYGAWFLAVSFIFLLRCKLIFWKLRGPQIQIYSFILHL